MAAIIIPSRRILTRVPPDSVRLDESRWCAGFLARGNGVIALPDGGNPQSISLGTDTNSIVGGIGLLGPCIKPTGQTRSTVRLESTAARINTIWSRPSAQVTVMCVFRRTGNAAGNAPIFSNASPNSSPYAAWSLVDRNGTGVLGFELSAGGAVRAVYTSSSVLTDAVPHVAIGVYDGSAATLYLDGKRVAGPVAMSGPLLYLNAADRGPAVGNFWQYVGGARSFVGEIHAGALSPRALSLAEIVNISANPWQIFRRPVRRTFVLPTSGGATPVSSSLTDTWTVRGSAQSGLPDTWAIRAAVQSSLTDTWEILSPAAVESRLAVSWHIRAAVQSSLTDSWRIGDLVPLTPDPFYLIRAARRHYLIGPRGIHMISAKDPAEIITVTFDFSHLADAVSAPIVTCNLARGLPHDDIPDMLLGAPEIIGRRILQRLTGGQAGNSYRLRCQIDDADGERWVVAGVMPVRRA